MASTPSTPAARLSYLIGPGPRATSAVSTLRIGLSNLDEGVHALRLRLAVFLCDGPGLPLVQAEWGGLLPRRSNRELDAALHWHEGELHLEQHTTRFDPVRTAEPARLYLVRAELSDGGGTTPEVLEVGLRSCAGPRGRP